MVKNEIKVFARLKPETKRKNIVNYQIHQRPKRHHEEDYLVLNGAQKSISEYINNLPESWNFAFYKIFDIDIKQNEVFENVAQPVVHSVLNGYNATIFAYGQTGSGKTFSITGDPERYEDRGVLPRTIQYLFEIIQKNPDNLYSVEIAYLEIYNENGYDLLDPKHEVVTKLEDLPRVTIQEDETGRLHLKNLSFRSVENERDALDLLFLGDTNRAISETPMNPQSSRSHCIFTIVVSVKQSGTHHLTKAKMHLVDLAGSERVYKCCISGTILTEAKYINLSLHYLEQVIVCLGQQNVRHIPYRNSLLTAILRDSLGGNCLTTMLATLSLNTSNFEETISTCRFSQRVALIKNDVNLVFDRNPEDENRFLKLEVERLRYQIAQLTKRSIICSQELTPNEKENLDFQVNKFLESDQTIDCENDEKKINYCFHVLRERLKNRNGQRHGVEESEKDLNYYRNLVVQRDKEISALINMLKTTGRHSTNNSADDSGMLTVHKNHAETSPRISIIGKKVRLRDLMVEARSIAELIKNGKASIGDLKTRVTDIKPSEIKMVHKNLQIEQSKLAHNLSLLKALKSEAKILKIALIEENEPPKNFVANLTATDIDQRLSVAELKSSIENSIIDDSKSSRKYPNSSTGVKLEDDEKSETIRSTEPSEMMSSISKEIKPRNSWRKYSDKDGYGVISTSLTEETNDTVKVPIPTRTITDVVVESSPSRLPGSKTTAFLKKNLQKPSSDNDSGRSSIGERFFDTRISSNGESRRSSFRAPAFLPDRFESSSSDIKVEPNLTEIENENLTDTTQSFGTDVRMSLDEPKSVVKFSGFDISNVPQNQELLKADEKDCEVYEDLRSSSRSKVKMDQSDQFYEALIFTEQYMKKDSEKSDIQVPQPIFIPDENRESNTIAEELIMSEDDNFMKSLPLTGDPEIDEEIIAFYRAQRSGGIY